MSTIKHCPVCFKGIPVKSKKASILPHYEECHPEIVVRMKHCGGFDSVDTATHKIREMQLEQPAVQPAVRPSFARNVNLNTREYAIYDSTCMSMGAAPSPAHDLLCVVCGRYFRSGVSHAEIGQHYSLCVRFHKSQ